MTIEEFNEFLGKLEKHLTSQLTKLHDLSPEEDPNVAQMVFHHGYQFGIKQSLGQVKYIFDGLLKNNKGETNETTKNT